MARMRGWSSWAVGVGRRLARRLSQASLQIKLLLAEKLGFKVVKSRYGPVFVANYQDATFRYYIGGSYGRVFWNRLRHITYPFVFLDIGANQGLYTIGATRNPNLVRCYAIEPVLETFGLLEQNVALNAATSRCHLIRKALADRVGFAEIALPANHSGGATLRQGTFSAKSTSGQIVELMDGAALQALIAEKTLDLVVKVDVEGLEPVVIHELLDMDLAPSIREIFLEVDERWMDATALFRQLEQAGFSRLLKVGRGHHYDVLYQRPES